MTGTPKTRGRRPTPDDEVNELGAETLSDEEYTQLLKALKNAALAGDVHARRQLLELHTVSRNAKAMDFALNITPYDIEDRKLGMIVQQADVPVVLEVLDGLSVRFEADEFSRDIKRTLVSLRQMFESEAERLYAPGKSD